MVTAEESQLLRDAGWTDPQIAEAIYITALFAFFNRVANAFGLNDPGYAFTHEGPATDDEAA
jgi:alkylhydroperoxidase family enzyme